MKGSALILSLLLLTGCRDEAASTTTGSPLPASAAATGNADTGKRLIEQYACLACHRIPGFEEPQGMLGPSLEGMARRPTIGGRVPNDARTMIAYLRNPPAVDPPTQMPTLGISEEEARHMTAYLYTLK